MYVGYLGERLVQVFKHPIKQWSATSSKQILYTLNVIICVIAVVAALVSFVLSFFLFNPYHATSGIINLCILLI